MSEPIVHEWRFYLDDMTGFAEKVLSYTDGFHQQSVLLKATKLRLQSLS